MLALKLEAMKSVFCTVVMVLSVPNGLVFVPITNHYTESSTYLDTMATTVPQLQPVLSPPNLSGSTSASLSWEWSIIHSTGRLEPSMCEIQQEVNASSISAVFQFPSESAISSDTLNKVSDDLSELPNSSQEPKDENTPLTTKSGLSTPLMNRLDYPSQPSPPIFNPLLKAVLNLTHVSLTCQPISLKERISREYLPLPGSDSGILLHLEHLRSSLRNIAFSTLPGPWAEWVINNRPMLGVVCVTTMYSSLLCPILLIACVYRKTKRTLTTDLLKLKRQCKAVESQLETLQSNKLNLLAKLLSANEEMKKMKELNVCSNQEIEVLRESNRQRAQQLNNMNLGGAHLESRLCSVRKALSCANYKILDYENEIKTLNCKLEDQEMSLALFSSKHLSAIEKVVALKEEKNQLEIENDTAKCAKETTFNCLKTLQVKFEKTKKKLEAALSDCAAKDEKLLSMKTELSLLEDESFDNNETICQQKEELERLQTSLGIVTKKPRPSTRGICTLEVIEEVDEEYELDLEKSTEQICTLNQELERKSSSLEQMKTESEDLKKFLFFLEAGYCKKSEQLREAERKLGEMAESFHAKESLLKKELTQARVQEYESKKKLMEAEREFEEKREEWKDVKQQLITHFTSLRYSKKYTEQKVELKCNLKRERDQLMPRSNEMLYPVKTSTKLYQPSTSKLPSTSHKDSPLLYSTKALIPKQIFPLPRTRSCSIPSHVSQPAPQVPPCRSESTVDSKSSENWCISSTTLVPGTLSGGPVQHVAPMTDTNDSSCATLTSNKLSRQY